MSGHVRFMVAAVGCALLAGWLTFSYAGRADQRDGRRVSVLVAPSGIEAGTTIDEAAAAALRVREIPERFAPPDGIEDAVDAVGSRALAPVAAGGFVTRSVLASGSETTPGYKLRAGERAVTVDAVPSPAGGVLTSGDRVDLLASGFGGDERTKNLISAAEILAVDDAQPLRVRLTLRLAAAQVAAVVRADVFARELRAVTVPVR